MEKLALTLVTVGSLCLIIPIICVCFYVHFLFGIFVLGGIIMGTGGMMLKYQEDCKSSNKDDIDYWDDDYD